MVDDYDAAWLMKSNPKWVPIPPGAPVYRFSKRGYVEVDREEWSWRLTRKGMKKLADWFDSKGPGE